VNQPEQRGLGDAVHQARNHVNSEPFLCLLGDTIFTGDVLPATQLIQAYQELKTAIIGLEEVPAEKVDRYGIVGGSFIRASVMKIDALVEKPPLDRVPSRFAIAARYILTPAIFECLDRTAPGKGGEIQLTDALQLLLKREVIHGVVLGARRHDIGNPVDWLKTNLIFARRHEAMWKEIEPLVRTLMSDEK
jgi:UTP--glucose-1-phosphate uridylyltransferase